MQKLKSKTKIKLFFDITNLQKVFIPLKENSKESILKYANLQNTPYDTFIQYTNCNIAILTGQINNIIVVDTDLYKNNGLHKWNELLIKINNGKDFNTLIIQTPRGGKHYYFNYADHQSRRNKDPCISWLPARRGENGPGIFC